MFETLSGLREVNGESRGHPKEIKDVKISLLYSFHFSDYLWLIYNINVTAGKIKSIINKSYKTKIKIKIPLSQKKNILPIFCLVNCKKLTKNLKPIEFV